MNFNKTFSNSIVLWVCFYPVLAILEALIIKKNKDGKFRIGSLDSKGNLRGFFTNISSFKEAIKQAEKIVRGRSSLSSTDIEIYLQQASLLAYNKHLHVTVEKYLRDPKDPKTLLYMQKACQACTNALTKNNL